MNLIITKSCNDKICEFKFKLNHLNFVTINGIYRYQWHLRYIIFNNAKSLSLKYR